MHGVLQGRRRLGIECKSLPRDRLWALSGSTSLTTLSQSKGLSNGLAGDIGTPGPFIACEQAPPATPAHPTMALLSRLKRRSANQPRAPITGRMVPTSGTGLPSINTAEPTW